MTSPTSTHADDRDPTERSDPGGGHDDGPTRLCVFCGSSSGSTPDHAAAAAELGRLIAERGVELVFGGGSVGLMGVLADAVLGAGGAAIGVMPGHLVAREVGHTALTHLEVTDSMHARKARMAELSDGAIALPGGFGTFEEVLEILTWNQLGLLTVPVVFCDVDGFYAPLFDFFDRAVEAGFLRPNHRALARRAGDPAAALDLALTPVAGDPQHKWIDLDRT